MIIGLSGGSQSEYYKRKYYKYKAKYFDLLSKKKTQYGSGNNQSKMAVLSEENIVLEDEGFLTLLSPESSNGVILVHEFNLDNRDSIMQNGLMTPSSYKKKFRSKVKGFRGLLRSPIWGESFLFFSPKLDEKPKKDNQIWIKVDPKKTYAYNRKFVNENQHIYYLTSISLHDLYEKINEFNNLKTKLPKVNENGLHLAYNIIKYEFNYVKENLLKDTPIYVQTYKHWYLNFEVVTRMDIPSIYFVDEAGSS